MYGASDLSFLPSFPLLPFFSAWKEERNTDMCSCAGRSSTNEYNFKDCVNFRKIAYDDYNAYKEASKNLTEHC